MNRHPFRWGSAVFGLLFAGAVLAWSVSELDVLDAETAGAVVAASLIVLGILGIVATVRISRRPAQLSVPPSTERPDHDGERLETTDDPDDVGTPDLSTETDTDTEEAPDGQEAPTQH